MYLALLSLACVPILFTTSDTSAITLTIVSGTEDQKINIPPTAEGKFVASDITTAKVVSDHAVGYTLTVSATALTDGTNTISTLDFGTSINADAFSSASNTQYNNKWGYLPATYYNGTTTITNNTNYFPAPIGDDNMATLDSTTAATPTGGTEYNVSVGARIDNTAIQGSYESVFTFAVVGKVTPYSITYNDPSGEATNMPSPNPLTGNVDESTSTVNLSSTVPTREGYTFKGWCNNPTSDDTCPTVGESTGTVYNLDGGGTNLAFPIDMASPSNTYTVYAMWQESAAYMQNWSGCSSLSSGDAVTLTDSRDNTEYAVGKLADNNCWMLDNLALDLTDSNVKAAMHNETDTKTNATYAQLGYLFNGGGSGDSSSSLFRYATAGVSNWTSSNSYSVPLVNLANKDTVPQGSDPMANTVLEGGWKTGGFYNYCAASAGTYCYGNGTSYTGSPSTSQNDVRSIDADICPSGWRLPTGNTSGEFQALYSNYNNYTNFRTAFHYPLYGAFNSGSTSGQGSYGPLWSSTRSRGNVMYGLSADTSTVNLASNNTRIYGYPLRCILGS